MRSIRTGTIQCKRQPLEPLGLDQTMHAGCCRTYEETPNRPVGYRGVEMEIKYAKGSDFVDRADDASDYSIKISSMARDRVDNARPAWMVQDGSRHFRTLIWRWACLCTSVRETVRSALRGGLGSRQPPALRQTW
jgi:hypothetical protein